MIQTMSLGEVDYRTTRWRVALGCFFGVLLASGFTASFAIFLLPVTKYFGWTRGTLSSAFFFAQLVAALCYPLFGTFIDRFGARRALGPALMIHGASIMALSMLNGSLVQLYIIYAFLGVGVALTGYVAYVKMISGWFGKNRGTMIGVSLGAGIAIGGTISPQISNWLLETFGWRNAYLLLGMPFFILGLPNLLLLRDPPQTVGAGGAAMPGIGLGEAVRTRTFWILFCATLFISVGWEGPKGHLVAMLTDRGEAKALATNLLSVVAFCSAMGRIFGGFMLDRVQTPRIAVFFFGMVLAGVSILDVASGNLLYVGAAVLGFGVGVELDVLAYFVSRYFGIRNYSQIYGATASTAILSYGLGPMVLGLFYDALGNYNAAILAMQGLIVLSVLLLMLLGPYVYPARNAIEEAKTAD
jgi:MFS family permease